MDPFIVRSVNSDSIKLLDNNNKFHDNIKTYEALRIASSFGLNLVCFKKAESNDLAFCKIIDYNKWKYDEEKRKKHEAKTNRKICKEMQFSPHIDENDINHKMRQVNGFLDEGDDVILVMRIRGRDRFHFTDAEEKMNNIMKLIDGHGKEVSRKKTNDTIIIRAVKGKNTSSETSNLVK